MAWFGDFGPAVDFAHDRTGVEGVLQCCLSLTGFAKAIAAVVLVEGIQIFIAYCANGVGNGGPLFLIVESSSR